MPDYSKGKIYKIVCNTTGLVYIGSSCEPTLARRLGGHKNMYKRFLSGKASNNLTSFSVLENNNFDIILIENIICLSKDELHSRERHFIENTECVNKVVPLRTSKEYRNENKDTIKEYNITYNKLNKSKISERKRIYLLGNRHKRVNDYQINKEIIKQKNIVYYQLNKEQILEKRKLKRQLILTTLPQDF